MYVYRYFLKMYIFVHFYCLKEQIPDHNYYFLLYLFRVILHVGHLFCFIPQYHLTSIQIQDAIKKDGDDEFGELSNDNKHHNNNDYH